MSNPHWEAYLKSIGADEGPVCPYCKTRPQEYNGRREVPTGERVNGKPVFQLIVTHAGVCEDRACIDQYHKQMDWECKKAQHEEQSRRILEEKFRRHWSGLPDEEEDGDEW